MTLKDQISAEIKTLKSQIAALEAYLQTLNVPANLRQEPMIIPAATKSSDGAISSTRPKAMFGQIKNIVFGIKGQFDVFNVMELARQAGFNFSKDQIAQAVSRLGRTGAINTIEAGAGRRPAIYVNK